MSIILFDFAVLGLIFLSGLLGAVRGLLRACEAMVCCAAAQLITLGIHDIIDSSLAIVAALFFASLIVLLVIAARIFPIFLDRPINKVDRSLGFLVGLVRGLLVAVVAFLLYDWLVPNGSQPHWIKNGQVTAILQSAGDWLMIMLPDGTEQGVARILAWVFSSITVGIALSLGIDFFAIVARWMHRRMHLSRPAL
jgi:membrane protein required for colicin V production